MRTDNDLPADTTEDVFDMIAKVLLLRAGGAAVISFEDLERAADTKCCIEKTNAGLIFRTEVDTKQ